MGSIIGKNTRRPDVSFYNNGRIDITSVVARVLNLHEGDVVDIDCQNGEYLLYVRLRSNEAIGRHEARCYPTKDGGHNFRTYSKKLCDAILTACNATSEARLSMGEVIEHPQIGVAIPLITRNNLA